MAVIANLLQRLLTLLHTRIRWGKLEISGLAEELERVVVDDLFDL